jgi:hypothetical protein
MVFQVNNSDNICDLMLQGNVGGYYVRFLLFQVNMLLCVKKKKVNMLRHLHCVGARGNIGNIKQKQPISTV